MFTCIVDESGYLVDIYLTDDLPTDIQEAYSLVEGALPNDIFINSENPPRWDGEKWVATGEPPVIELDLQIPSEADRLDAIESTLLAILMMGG